MCESVAAESGRCSLGQMEEVPLAGEDHGDAELVGPRDVVVVLHRAAGLDDDGDAGVGRRLDAVGERVEGVAGAGAALGAAGGLGRGDLAGLDAVLLTGADAPRGAVLHQDDGVALHPADQAPGQLGVGPLGLASARAW